MPTLWEPWPGKTKASCDIVAKGSGVASRAPDSRAEVHGSRVRRYISGVMAEQRRPTKPAPARAIAKRFEADLSALASLGDRIDLDEVATVYLPLAQLLNLHVTASRSLWAAQSDFLGDSTAKVPFVIAVAGSVAVGW